MAMDGWLYCTVEWVGECGSLGSLRKHSQCKTSPFPSPQNLRPCAFFATLKRNKQTRRAGTNNGNIHDYVKLRRSFSQLSFMYVLFSFNVFFNTHFRVMLSFERHLTISLCFVKTFTLTSKVCKFSWMFILEVLLSALFCHNKKIWNIYDFLRKGFNCI